MYRSAVIHHRQIIRALLILRLHIAQTDPETVLLIRRMKQGSGEDAFDDFEAEMSPMQIAQGLAQALEEIEMLDYLFQDPARAVAEMEKEGMIPSDKLTLYKKDPALLEEDTRK